MPRRRLAMLVLAAVACLLQAGAAHGGVEIVEEIDLADESTRGAAIGLTVPGAGPTTTRRSALNTLLTGTVESSLVGGTPEGKPKITLDADGPLSIRVVLPPTAQTRNTIRYPISVRGDGVTGVLTSDSTRIRGLVSLADIANGRLHWEPDTDPVKTIDDLNTRIDRNQRIRLPLTLGFVAAAALIGLFRPRWGPRLALLALAANLWLVGWWAVAALFVVVLALPIGLASAAVIAAYALALGLDPEAVALSPFGPSQAGRFFGVSNLLATLLLVPAVLGVARIRPRVLALPLGALAVVTIGSGRLGADGGGLLVLLTAYAVLTLRSQGLRHKRHTTRTALGFAAVATITVLVIAIDAAFGGSSHVSATLGDGPGAVLSELGHRLELSWHRATGSIGAGAATAAGLTGLLVLGLRRPSQPIADAVIAALVVSLLVNDTPTDVAAVGAAVLFLVQQFEARSSGGRAPSLDRLITMRRKISAAALAAGLMLAIAGCGGEEVGSTPVEDDGSAPTVTDGGSSDLPALELTGNPEDGKSVFDGNGCGSCHALSAAGASGSVGPNLDDSKPSFELAVTRVTSGQGGMPAFAESLEPQQIADVAQFIVESAGG